MDPATIARLAREYPERYRGGKIDRYRLRHLISDDEARDRGMKRLEEGNEARAAYWAGFVRGREG